MLTFNYRYQIYPDATQEKMIQEWMDICRGAYNYGLREIKDWCDSRKCLIDRCSLEKEYILPASAKFPNEISQPNNLPRAKKEWTRLALVPSQVLQQVIKQLASICLMEGLVNLEPLSNMCAGGEENSLPKSMLVELLSNVPNVAVKSKKA